MLPYISLATDAVASFAVIISVFFLLKELRLTRDSIKHSDFMNSINRSAENMLRITENDSLLRTIEKISVYRGQKSRNRSDLARIIRNLPLREKHRYFHFQRNVSKLRSFLGERQRGVYRRGKFFYGFWLVSC